MRVRFLRLLRYENGGSFRLVESDARISSRRAILLYFSLVSYFFLFSSFLFSPLPGSQFDPLQYDAVLGWVYLLADAKQ